MLVSPPRSSPNISRPRGTHLLNECWMACTVTNGSPLAAASIQRRMAPRRRQVECLLAQHRRHGLRERPIRAHLLHGELVLADAVDHRREHHVVDERVVGQVEGLEDMAAGLHLQHVLDHVLGFGVRRPRPVAAREQMEHLIAVAQLLGHHAQHPESILVVLSAVDRHLVLLDRAELGRRLGANDRQQVLAPPRVPARPASRSWLAPPCPPPRRSWKSRRPAWRTGRIRSSLGKYLDQYLLSSGSR